MVWAKIDDKYSEHPKVIAAGEEAAWVNVKAILWSCKFLTDGFIPEEIALHLADIKPLTRPHRAKRGAKEAPEESASVQIIERLTRDFHGRPGLWERVVRGYVIHDFLDYNPSKDAVEAERRAARTRQDRFRERKTGRFGNGEVTASSHRDAGVSNAVTNALVTSTPSQPVPARTRTPLPTLSPPGPDPGGEKGGNSGEGTPEPSGLWERTIRKLLASGMERVEANRWFGPTREVGLVAGDLVVEVPPGPFIDWIPRHYGPDIDVILGELVNGEPPRLRLELASESPR